MSPHLRLERRSPTSWSIADGSVTVGRIDADRLVLHGFPDAPSANAAADLATLSLRHPLPEPAA
jgi:hypothetical protein